MIVLGALRAAYVGQGMQYTTRNNIIKHMIVLRALRTAYLEEGM